MTDEEYKAALERRLEGFRILNEWEEANPLSVSPEVALACVNDLYELLPRELRSRPEHLENYISLRRGLEILNSIAS